MRLLMDISQVLSQASKTNHIRVVYLLLTAAIVIGGVNKGIERFSKVLMPILVVLIFAIGIFSLTLHYKDASGTVRSGLEDLRFM